VQARVREGVKVVPEEVFQEEMTEHLKADHRELTPTRRGERNGHYTRNLLTRRARSNAWRSLEIGRASS
jgi:putative transposase